MTELRRIYWAQGKFRDYSTGNDITPDPKAVGDPINIAVCYTGLENYLEKEAISQIHKRGGLAGSSSLVDSFSLGKCTNISDTCVFVFPVQFYYSEFKV
jgi:hypothetical protein